MTNTRQINDKEEIKAVIRETFVEDKELFDKFHFINGNVELAIEDTFKKIAEMVDTQGAEFYKLSDGGETIGYINVAPKIRVLHSFGLKKDCRDEKRKKEMIELIDSFFPDGIVFCILFSKNSRGIKFLKNNGFMQEETVTLIKHI